MQIKIFTIPIVGGEEQNAELNIFLRSKKVLEVEQQMTQQSGCSFWSFSIKYLDDHAFSEREKPKVDYRKVLTETEFERFSKLRAIRKEISKEEDLPAYTIFTDEELAGIAKIELLTLAEMKSVKNIGEKKIEKYGQRFLSPSNAK